MVGIAILAVGVLYWALWRIVPGWFGYDFIPSKERLSDGTVVTVVRPIFNALEMNGADVDFPVLGQKD